MPYPTARQQLLFCFWWISKTRARAGGARPKAGLLGSVAAARFCGGAGERTARRSLAGRELGAVPGRRGRGRSSPKRLRQLRAGIAAVRRAGECGGSRGTAGRERPSERTGRQGREGARESARLRIGGRLLPLPHPGLCAPRAPLLHPSARLRACRFGSRLPARRPPHPQRAPASERPPPPRRGDAPSPTSRSRHCFPAVGSPGPALPSERGPSSPQSQPRRVLPPLLFSRGWQPPSRLRRAPLHSVLLIFSGRRRLPSAPEASLSAPLHGPHPLRVPGGPQGTGGPSW